MPMIGMRRHFGGREWLTLALAIFVVGAAYFYKLGGAALWGDEAGTGLFARNVLHFGYPTGFDGRNLSIYDGGAELNANLTVAKLPWIQFYVGALSLEIFGDSASGLRTLFAVLGLAALFPMRAALRTRVPFPLFVATLILITPQVALFHRNARYYSALTLLFALLVWMVCSDGLSKAGRLCIACIGMVLLFHTHPVAASACGVALLIHARLQGRHFIPYLIACTTGLGSWLLWTAFVGPTLVAPQLFMDFQGQPTIGWLWAWMRNEWMSLLDMDAVQGMPVLAWALGLGTLWKMRPHQFFEFFKDPVVSFVMLTLVVHTFVVALLFGTETSEEHSLLRYMPHLIAFGAAALYILMAKLVKDERLFAVICVALVATNLFSVSFWSGRAEKEIPVSWWPATYREILQPQTEAMDTAIAVIGSESSVAPNKMETLLAIPPWLQEVGIFYLGEKFIVAPHIEPGSPAESVVRAKIGLEALSRFRAPPKWILYEAADAPASVPGYERVQIQTHRLRPDDGTRPELTRHTFYQRDGVGHISLYKRLN